MQKPRSIRRLTSAVLKRQWKRRLVQDLGFHVTHELLGMYLSKTPLKWGFTPHRAADASIDLCHGSAAQEHN